MAKQRKNDIKFNITLDEGQKEVKGSIYNSEVTVVTGMAGSGKTLAVTHTLLDMVFKGEVSNIYITRPTVSLGEEIGYLPGTQQVKLSPFLEPFIDNFYKCYDEDKVNKHLTHFRDGEENTDKNANRKSVAKIEGTAIQFIRGKTISDKQILVVDESQNTTVPQMMAILGRLGKGGRIVIIGDPQQRDTKETYTGLDLAVDLAKNIPEIKLHKLTSNHRSPLIEKIHEFVYNNKKI